jgi:hypothetical protein
VCEQQKKGFFQKHWILIIGLMSLVFPISGIVFFVQTFWGMEYFSKNPTEWGQFGDYFNWIIGWVIGVANLILLYNLTQVANRLDESRLGKELDFQQKSLQKQLTFELYKDFITKLDDYTTQYAVIQNSIENDDDIAQVKKSKLYLAFIFNLAKSGKENFNELFVASTGSANELQECFDVLITATENYIKQTDGENLDKFRDSVFKLKTSIFKQVKIDTK